MCRACDFQFACKAELLEHEQEMHTASSASSTPSRRKSAAAHPAGSASSAGSFGKFATASHRAGGILAAVAINLPVDHEEVYESHQNTKSAVGLVPRSGAASVQKAITGIVRAAKQTESSVAEHRQTSFQHSTGRSHDHESVRIDRSRSVPVTSMASQIGSSQPIQAESTAVQNRAPASTLTTSNSPVRGMETNQSQKGDVVTALGLARTGDTMNSTVTGSANVVIDDNDTKPPVSESGPRIGGPAVRRYEVLGSINERPICCRDIGVQTDVPELPAALPELPAALPALTKTEATSCVERLHQGDSYVTSVNNDELQLLAAVSSTRSRDVVEPERLSPEDSAAVNSKPESPSPVASPQQVNEVVMSSPTDIVEQEVELETSTYEGKQRKAGGRPAKKRSGPGSGSKSPVSVVKLPMTSHQFTATDGTKKRMVAITVARPPAPRMVSVLLRNRGNAGSEDQVEWQETETSEIQATDVEPDEESPAPAAAESGSASDVLDEVAALADAVLGTNEANKMPTEAVVKAAGLKRDKELPETVQCVYCSEQFSPEKLAEHISLSHVCNHCGRKFRQPANLRKVIVSKIIDICELFSSAVLVIAFFASAFSATVYRHIFSYGVVPEMRSSPNFYMGQDSTVCVMLPH